MKLDCRQDVSQIRPDLVIRESQDSKPARLKPLVAIAVVSRGQGVMYAISLDDQSVFEAYKVNDVFAEWKLASELQSLESSAPQDGPKHPLGCCGGTPKGSGASCGACVMVCHDDLSL